MGKESKEMTARIFLARRSSFSVGGCSMRITEHRREGSNWVDDIQGHPRGRVGRAWRTRQDVRKFAAEQKISEEQALQAGLEQKANEWSRARMRRHRRGGPRGR